MCGLKVNTDETKYMVKKAEGSKLVRVSSKRVSQDDLGVTLTLDGRDF